MAFFAAIVRTCLLRGAVGGNTRLDACVQGGSAEKHTKQTRNMLRFIDVLEGASGQPPQTL